MPPTRVVIIGAGPTGLGAAWRLNELLQQGRIRDVEWTLLEASDHVGGLSATLFDAGTAAEAGGHVLHSHYTYFDDLMLKVIPPDGWLHHARSAWCYIRSKMVPYPLQNHIHHLPESDQWACVQSLLTEHCQRVTSETKETTPKNFAEYLERTFGSALCDLWIRKYNVAVWSWPPEQMNASWVGDRVSSITLESTLKAVILKQDHRNYGPNAEFLFPARGGTGAIWKALARQLPSIKIKLNSPVTRVNHLAKTVDAAGGDVYAYDHLITTVPLDLLVLQAMTSVPQELQAHAKSLIHSSTHVVLLAVDMPTPECLKTKCWMYFAEDYVPFYRATVLSHYGLDLVEHPERQYSLMLEVSESSYKPVNLSTVLDQVEQACVRIGMITDQSLIYKRIHQRFEHGYPTPSVGRDDHVWPLLDWLREHQIRSIGRFGRWAYEVGNQDHSLMQGVETVDNIFFDTAELTLRQPNVVNAPGKRTHPEPYTPVDPSPSVIST